MKFDYPKAAATTRAVLRASLRDRAEQLQVWLLEGRIKDVFALVDRIPTALADLLPIVADPEANLNVRFGAHAVLERYAGTQALQALIPALAMLSGHGDPRVRADACHLLGLTGSPAAIEYLEARRDDPDPDVREIVAESLAELQTKED